MAYISQSWDNHWALLEQLITEGELDIMLSPIVLYWLSETEYLRLEDLAEEAEWTALLNDRATPLHELPLDLDPFLSFLDEKVGGFIAPPSWSITSGFMKPIQVDKIFKDVHIRRLQRLRVAQ